MTHQPALPPLLYPVSFRLCGPLYACSAAGDQTGWYVPVGVARDLRYEIIRQSEAMRELGEKIDQLITRLQAYEVEGA